ncbi:hypothetical protein [Pantoea sp. KPR_PJ]|uniref:hypothetical protein n=1 Tax=Pantoea sp. KPR_PJ TaxID=2738375 RepID=UPI0035283852
MKVKDNLGNEILSNLKRLEEYYEEALYFNNSPPDMRIVATKGLQQYLSKRKKLWRIIAEEKGNTHKQKDAK